jgi:hypothetical protein
MQTKFEPPIPPEHRRFAALSGSKSSRNRENETTAKRHVRLVIRSVVTIYRYFVDRFDEIRN